MPLRAVARMSAKRQEDVSRTVKEAAQEGPVSALRVVPLSRPSPFACTTPAATASSKSLAPSQSVHLLRPPPPPRKGGMDSYLHRNLSQTEVAQVDEDLARFCYAEGLPFRALASPWLRKAIGRLNPHCRQAWSCRASLVSG